MVAAGDLQAGGAHGVGRHADLAQDRGDLVGELIECGADPGQLVTALGRQPARQVAVAAGDVLQRVLHLGQAAQLTLDRHRHEGHGQQQRQRGDGRGQLTIMVTGSLAWARSMAITSVQGVPSTALAYSSWLTPPMSCVSELPLFLASCCSWPRSGRDRWR